MRQNEAKIKQKRHEEIIYRIKSYFHKDLVGIPLSMIRIIMFNLIKISPFSLMEYLIDNVYLPIWISLDENPNTFKFIIKKQLK